MSNEIDKDKPASEQFDLSTDFNENLLDPEKLHAVAAELEKIPNQDISCHATDLLADHVDALKRLESAAEDARKDGYEAELEPRIDDGEQVRNLEKRQGASSYVTDTEGAFAAVTDAGADPLDVAKISVGNLRDVLGPQADEYLGQSEYSYFVRQA